jgi:hypothetical protein
MKQDEADYNGTSTTTNTPQGPTPLLKQLIVPTRPHQQMGEDRSTPTRIPPFPLRNPNPQIKAVPHRQTLARKNFAYAV